MHKIKSKEISNLKYLSKTILAVNGKPKTYLSLLCSAGGGE